jgi:hypothetical protein
MTTTLTPTITICAWCPHPRARTQQAQAAGHVVSHGLCPACAARLRAEDDREAEAVPS